MESSIPRIIELPRFLDPRGNLAVIEECREIPFKIKRCHWIYDVPGGGGREGHAYRTTQEFIVALSGSFDVAVGLGSHRQVFRLDRTYFGLYLPPWHWREIINFSTNSVAVILSSTPYDEGDYIFDIATYADIDKNNVHS